jgi:hypothetical protein
VYLDGLYVDYVYTHFATVRDIFTYTLQSSKYISQQCTNRPLWRLIFVRWRRSSVGNLLCVAVLASGVLRWILSFGEIFVPLHYTHLLTRRISNGSCLCRNGTNVNRSNIKCSLLLWLTVGTVTRPRAQRMRLKVSSLYVCAAWRGFSKPETGSCVEFHMLC